MLLPAFFKINTKKCRSNGDFNSEFFSDLSLETSPYILTRLPLSSGEFPFTAFHLGKEILPLFVDAGRSDVNRDSGW